MPYKDEESSLIASAKFNQEILNNKTFHSNFLYSDRIREKLIIGLDYLSAKNNQYNYASNPRFLYENLLCIDGSIISIQNNQNGEFIGMQFGSVTLNTQDLLKIQKNKFYIPNPFEVSKLFQSPNNIITGGVFPSKNIHYFNGNEYATLKDSYIYTLNSFFSSGGALSVKKSFLEDTNKPLSDFTRIPEIKKITDEIRDDNILYGTYKETQKIMLISEVLLAQFLLNEYSDKASTLIIIDGRLHNEDIGGCLEQLNRRKIKTTENMLVGVQKTGMLNSLLTRVHEIIREQFLAPIKSQKTNNFESVLGRYAHGNSLFFVIDEKFKEICGIRSGFRGVYGRECFYISSAPCRREFVFTLPTHLFEDQFQGLVGETLSRMSSIFEYINTNLYFANKGVLLTNIMAHENVALNKEYTKSALQDFSMNNNDSGIYPTDYERRANKIRA